MEVAVVIPTCNRGAELPTMLRAVAEDATATEIIVVLDGCTDGSAQVVAELSAKDERFRSLSLSPNVGPAEARRRGVDLARAAVVVCLDDDVIVSPGCVAGHARHHRQGDAEVVVGYMPVATDARRGVVGRRYAEIYEDQALEWQSDPSTVLRYLWGGNVSYRKEDYLRAAGGCDPTLRFGEDQEMGLVLGEMGRRAVFDRNLRGQHLYERDVVAARRDQVRAGEGYARLLERHPGALPTAAETFAPERRSRMRRLAVKGSGLSPVSRAITAVLLALESRRPGTAAAWALLRVATRADFFRGFHSHHSTPH